MTSDSDPAIRERAGALKRLCKESFVFEEEVEAEDDEDNDEENIEDHDEVVDGKSGDKETEEKSDITSE